MRSRTPDSGMSGSTCSFCARCTEKRSKRSRSRAAAKEGSAEAERTAGGRSQIKDDICEVKATTSKWTTTHSPPADEIESKSFSMMKAGLEVSDVSCFRSPANLGNVFLSVRLCGCRMDVAQSKGGRQIEHPRSGFVCVC